MDNFKGKRKFYAYELSTLLILVFFVIFFIYTHFIYNENILKGLKNIMESQSILITDFLVVGGIGGGFLNAFLILFLNFFIIKILKIKVSGIVLASLFTVFGFSFFGKNILNILPIYIGGIIYSKYEGIPFRDIFIRVSFATALAPFISEIAFSTNSFEFSYINGIVFGIFIGFIISPLAKKMKSFHEGYNLYNMGFVGGILGTVLNSILKSYGFNVASRKILSTKYDPTIKLFCYIIFTIFIIVGFYINNYSFKGFNSLSKDSGLESDFVTNYGYGLTFINMGLMGFVAITFPIILKEPLNGPILAGIFTIVGFAAHGKTYLNAIPILLGVLLAGLTGNNFSSFTIVLSGLFATSLAPISGVFGFAWGIVAGWIHLTVVTTIGAIHGGLNLYNNGFSAGIVAGFMLPILRTLNERAAKKELKFFKKRKEFLDIINSKKIRPDEFKNIEDKL